MTVETPFRKLLAFLDRLEHDKVWYRLEHVRNSIMVTISVPGERWEIEFFEDGTLEVELFPRTKGVDAVNEEWLDRFIEENRE